MGAGSFPADHTNLGGQVLEEEPPSQPSLQEGCALTEGLSAGELPWEEQRAELEMTDRKGYHLYQVGFPRANKEECRSWWIDRPHTSSTLRNLICPTVIYSTEESLTLQDVDSVRALGDLLACKEYVDGVRALQHGTVGATENAVALILQDELDGVLFALRIDNDHADIAIASTWGRRQNN